MQISKETITLFRNFASINGSIMIQEGNRLATLSESKTIMAEATIAESFPMNFGIYDLSEFLSILALFPDSPELTFQEKYVTIADSDNRNKVKYYSAGESIVKAAPPSIKFPEPEIEFELSQSTLDSIRKIASTLKTSDVSIVGIDGQLKIIVTDKKNPTGNAFETLIGETDKTFQANMKIENMKFVPGTYNVYLSKMKISKFVNKDLDLNYFVAVEADSVFDGM